MLSTNEFEHWWYSERASPPPGNLAIFFGAGISIEAPTSLPSGISLTRSLARHILDERAAKELLDTFEQHAHVVGRSVPRLEILFSAVKSACGDRALELLRIFENAPFNHVHSIIAEQLISTKSWAITTNFDECIESASNYCIPVHVLDPKTQQIRVLYGPADATWGLVKLHGTIGDGVIGLGATIENLSAGLHPAYRKLLDTIFDSVDLLIATGYSASDHFDVNAHLRSRINERYAARVLWIEHDEGELTFNTPGPDTPGCEIFRLSFAAWAAVRGKTSHALQALTGFRGSASELSSSEPWLERLPALFAPTDADRHRVAAHIFCAIGMATAAHEAVSQHRHKLENDCVLFEMEAEAFRHEGLYQAADDVLRRWKKISGSDVGPQRVRLWREAGHIRKAFMILSYTYFVRRISSKPDSNTEFALEAAALVIAAYEHAQRWTLFRSVPMRWFMDRILDAITLPLRKEEHDSWTEARIQRLWFRQVAICRSVDDENAGVMAFWHIIEDGYYPPQLYVDGKPLIPGFFLVEPSTAMELDRIADVFDIKLEFARLLLGVIRRKYLNNMNMAKWAFRRLRYDAEKFRWEYRTKIRRDVEALSHKALDHIAAARSIAEMLNEEHYHVRAAMALVEANQLLGGVSWWKRQRLYLGARKSELAKLNMARTPNR